MYIKIVMLGAYKMCVGGGGIGGTKWGGGC